MKLYKLVVRYGDRPKYQRIQDVTLRPGDLYDAITSIVGGSEKVITDPLVLTVDPIEVIEQVDIAHA